MKPILFNTYMVRAILDGRKTQTRRIIKPQPRKGQVIVRDGSVFRYSGAGNCRPQFQPGDILYVRETWTKLWYVDPDGYTHYDKPMFYYAADGTPHITLCDEDGFALDDQLIRWRPSIHMPKAAARIFLRVSNIRVERLKDMTEEDAFAEGYKDCNPWCYHLMYENYPDSPIPCFAASSGECPPDSPCNHSIPELFGIEVWNTTIKKTDLARYGWDANPWVWVIEFQRIGREEAIEVDCL